MGITKWIFAGLGWVLGGPLSALLGFMIGNAIERNKEIGDGSDNFSQHRGPYRNTGTQEDVNVALIFLIAAVIKADGNVRRSELDYVKRFLLKNYGEEMGKQYLTLLRDLV